MTVMENLKAIMWKVVAWLRVDTGEPQALSVNEDWTLNTSSRAIDSSWREWMNTVFWDRIVWNRKPSLASQFQYWLPSSDANSENTGTWNISFFESMLVISTGASINSSAMIQSNTFLRYVPWHEWYCFFTDVFTEPKVWSKQRAWLYDWVNWFIVWYTDTQFEFVIIRDWVETKNNIDISKVFSDWSFNPLLWNIYKISFAYLWFWPIHLEVMTPTWGWVVASEFHYPNSKTVTHILQTFLPVRAEVINTTNDTNIEMRVWSLSAWIVDWSIDVWGDSDPSARHFTYDAPIKSASSWVMMTFRNKWTYNWIENRVSALLKLITWSTDWNKSVKFKLLRNPEEIIPWIATWNDISPDSTLEVSLDYVLEPWAEDWDAFLNWNMAKIDTFFEDVSKQNLLLPPNWVAVFYFESQNTTEVDFDIRWAELF